MHRRHSGILLFAKTQVDREILIRQFLAIRRSESTCDSSRGLSAKEGLWSLFRAKNVPKAGTEKDAQSARAELRYSVERPLNGATLVRVALVTGLQNQIRAQFSAIGHPSWVTEISPARSSERRSLAVSTQPISIRSSPRVRTSMTAQPPRFSTVD